MPDKGRHDRRKHAAKGSPALGNGKKGGKKPKAKDIKQCWPNGAVMSFLTEKLWGHKG